MTRTRSSSAERIRELTVRGAEEEAIDEGRLQALWRGTRHKIGRPAPAWQLIGWSVAGTLAVGSLALFAFLRAPSPAFLTLESGSAPVAYEVAADDAPIALDFSEGSQLVIAPGARVVPTHNDAERFEVVLERGALHVSVTPGLSRRWRFVAGDLTVDVVGTEFDLVRDLHETRIEMDHGVVELSGPGLPEGRTLSTGENLVVPDGPHPRDSNAGVGEHPESATRESANSEPAPEPSAMEIAEVSPESRGEARELRPLVAPENSPPPVSESAPHSEDGSAAAEGLLARADAARDRGDALGAAQLLEQLLAEHPTDPVAPLAATTLGRIEMDVLHRPERARRALSLAQRLGVPSALRRDVEVRLRALGGLDGARP